MIVLLLESFLLILCKQDTLGLDCFEDSENFCLIAEIVRL